MIVSCCLALMERNIKNGSGTIIHNQFFHYEVSEFLYWFQKGISIHETLSMLKEEMKIQPS